MRASSDPIEAAGPEAKLPMRSTSNRRAGIEKEQLEAKPAQFGEWRSGRSSMRTSEHWIFFPKPFPWSRRGKASKDALHQDSARPRGKLTWTLRFESSSQSRQSIGAPSSAIRLRNKAQRSLRRGQSKKARSQISKSKPRTSNHRDRAKPISVVKKSGVSLTS